MTKLLKGIIVTIVIVFLIQQFLLRPIIELAATQIVGARVSLGGFSVNIFKQQFRLDHLRIYNEEGFSSQVFFDASEILVGIDTLKLMQGKIHLPVVVFHLDKMIICKNSKGKLNVDELKIVQQKLNDKSKQPPPNFKIDELNLNIEQVIVEDDSQTPPSIKAYDLNLKNKTIRNVDSVSKLVGIILIETLKPTALQSAGLYAATTLLGISFLPALALGVALANDEAVSDLLHSKGEVFERGLQLVQRLGKLKKTDDATGHIYANIDGTDITLEIQDRGWGHSWIMIKARKYFIARPEIAAGLLYQLKQELR